MKSRTLFLGLSAGLGVRHGFLASAVAVFACVVTGCADTTAPERPGSRDTAVIPDYVAPDVRRVTARTLRTYEVPEAEQGVAADSRFFYPVDNTALGKYEISSGRLVDRWIGPRNGLVRHLNSCLADDSRIWCANSNYSLTPMGSSVEVFDASTLDHVSSHSLGMRDEGSLTWIDRYQDPPPLAPDRLASSGEARGWLAGFAHYDENGGLPFKDHTFSSVVTFDAEWRRTGGWLFPQSAIERMAPHAASGGAIGPDGWLYLLGHDRPEMYVVARPPMGPTLIHIATIDLEVQGQAFSWARDGTRTIFAIDRSKLLVRTIEIPPVTPTDASAVVRFR